MKRMLTLFLILLLAVSVFWGCKKEEQKEAKEETKKEEVKTTVDIFQFKVEFKDQFTALAKEYME